MKYAEVAVLAHTNENFNTFTYSLPKDVEPKIGQIMKVPFRNRELYAVAIEFVKKPEFKTKEVSKIIDIILPEHLINLAKWMSEYYAASINSVLRTILPAGFYKKRRGIISAVTNKNAKPNPNIPKLTSDQTSALRKIGKTKKPCLLFGVTGSGKTEIYLRLIEEQIKKGKGSIVLVPEIALTPQTIQRFEERFLGQVAVLHSHLKETERQKNWNEIAEGKKKIAIGSRSAIFAPFKNLGVIVIDEEHESSYKQEQTPRYDTVKVAEKISELTGAKLILGSATPRIESFYKGKSGSFELLHLNKRIHGDKMPNVNIVDLRKEYKAGNRSTISIPLQNKMEEVLAQNKKILLLLNRRGASTYVFCRDCGYVELCPECEIPLTFHLNKNLLLCHHCNFRRSPQTTCPSCKGLAFRYLGAGTQKVEMEIKDLFPKAKVSRMDKDTTTEQGSHEKLYTAFAKGDTDIIIGTQMIAKGWDIEDVELVGVILADIGLNFPDFRSEEKIFSLLTQVAGRAGRRDSRGEVMIQTFCPENLTILSATAHDYEKFYEKEIQTRKGLGFPPFCELIKLYLSGNNPEEIGKQANQLKEILSRKLNKNIVQILGPSPSFFQKQRNAYTWHMLIKYHGNITQDMLNLLPKGWSIDVDPTTTI